METVDLEKTVGICMNNLTRGTGIRLRRKTIAEETERRSTDMKSLGGNRTDHIVVGMMEKKEGRIEVFYGRVLTNSKGEGRWRR